MLRKDGASSSQGYETGSACGAEVAAKAGPTAWRSRARCRACRPGVTQQGAVQGLPAWRAVVGARCQGLAARYGVVEAWGCCGEF